VLFEVLDNGQRAEVK